jgi:hypothetical protein
MPGCEGLRSRNELCRSHQGRDAEFPCPDDPGSRPVAIEEYRKRNALVLDECLRVPLAARADRRDRGSRGEDLVIPVADLTGPLTTGQSAEVAQEQQHLRAILPQITESVFSAVGIEQDDVGEFCSIERHHPSSWLGSGTCIDCSLRTPRVDHLILLHVPIAV